MDTRKKPLVVLQTYEERQPLKLNSEITQKEAIEKLKTSQPVSPLKSNKGPPLPPPMPPGEAMLPAKETTPLKLTLKKDEIDNVLNNDVPLPDRAPMTPTPDYDTLEKPKVKMPLINGTTRNSADPFESPKLNSPTLQHPKSPNSNGSQVYTNGTMKKSVRPISITIGEYPSNIARKEPSKLDFLSESDVKDTRNTESEPIGSRLQSELAKTLSRSNLKKKTEALELKLSQKMDNLIMDNKNFHMRYPDTGVIMTPPSISIPKISAKLSNGLAKIHANATKDVNGTNVQKAVPNYHQVTMVIKDNHISSSN